MKTRCTAHSQRVAIVERHIAGETLAAIAADMGLSKYTARKWWRIYRKRGWAGLAPRSPGPPSTGALSRFDPLVRYVALRLKAENPGWGPDLLLLHMGRRESLKGKRLPGRTALYNYLRPFYLRLRADRRPRVRRPKPEEQKVQGVHDSWQMDYKGKVEIKDSDCIKPFIIVDEFTSAPLVGIIHPGDRRGQPGVTSRDVQTDLREAFAEWGLPKQIRMDRDPTWVGSSRLEWPGVVLLWLVGMNVTPVINRPGRPTDNPNVERGNRTWNEHVGLSVREKTMSDVQALTDQAWQDRREHLPSRNPQCDGQPPLVAHPELAIPQRPYVPEHEEELFDMQRVYNYLSQWEWERTVSTDGYISLADINRRVSKNHAGQVVKVHFDKDQAVFIARSVDGTELCKFTLPVISREYILGQGVHNL